MGSYLSAKKRIDSVLGLNPQITKLKIQGQLPFPSNELQQCSYHSDKMEEKYDVSIRNCFKGVCSEPRFTKATQPILNKYCQHFQHKLAKRSDEWEILQYQEGGCFNQHRDRQIASKQDNLVHVAMEILIPPKSLCKATFGILIIFEDRSSFSHPSLSADENQWTHIILPLGIFHEVKKVSDRRITYNKKVFVEKQENLDYSIPLMKSRPQQMYN